MLSIDKQKALRHDCIYNIEYRDLKKRVSGVYLIYYNILTLIDDATPDWFILPVTHQPFEKRNAFEYCSRCKSIQHIQDEPERKT